LGDKQLIEQLGCAPRLSCSWHMCNESWPISTCRSSVYMSWKIQDPKIEGTVPVP
jgi:hypothetical protein